VQEPGSKVALITGSSRGIGRATARLLAQRGFDIVIHYRRDEAAAHEAAEEIRHLGRRALVVNAELADHAQTAEMVETAAAHFGRLDAVVANAASSTFRPLQQARPHHITRTFDTIVGSFLAIVRSAAPILQRSSDQPRTSRIVTVSGFDTVRVLPDHGLLAAAKAALEQLTRYLAVELAPHTTVNSVVPGYVDTDSARLYAETSVPGGWDAAAKQWAEATPLGRVATVDEVARIIAFLCGDDAGWLTGQLLVADGGLTLR
jgi:enoyl-[acyl-carrier protein] reductase III